MKRTQQGFTLVEIAIVLVIVGLLLGGILKGQEMITQAKVKNAITDFSGVSAAYFGYQDRYRATPGDDGGATRWGAESTTLNAGDNNRILAGTYNVDCSGADLSLLPESCNWWDHLRRSGFIAGSGANQPVNAFNGKIGVQTGDGASGTALGGFTNLILCSSNLPDKVSIALEAQMDDGVPASGAVRGQLHGATDNAYPNVAATAAATFLETGTNIYTLCRPF